MCKIRSSEKRKKNTSVHWTASDSVCNEFFLGDIAFTLLPIGIILLLNISFGMPFSSILLISDWPFSSIIISYLALTRMIELKVVYQKDTSAKVLFLTRICIILIILSVVCYLLYIFKQQNIKINDIFVIFFQFALIFSGSLLLHTAHSFREERFFNRKEFPISMFAVDFHDCLKDNLEESRNKIRANRLALEKEYNFEVIDDLDKMEKYGKQELKQLVEDIQNDLTTFKQRLDAWNKPPYHSEIPHEQQQDESL